MLLITIFTAREVRPDCFDFKLIGNFTFFSCFADEEDVGGQDGSGGGGAGTRRPEAEDAERGGEHAHSQSVRSPRANLESRPAEQTGEARGATHN